MGFDLHMRNLQWAFSNFEHHIFLQTFSAYDLAERANLSITSYNADPKRYFPFLEQIDIGYGDLVVLVQQDNLFPHKIDAVVSACALGSTVTWDQHPYFSIHDQQDRKVYPRVAEVSTFMPRELVEEMRSLGLCYGTRGRQFQPAGQLYKDHFSKLHSHKICSRPLLPAPQRFELLSDFCHQRRKDTMFDISIYCFCADKPVELLAPDAMIHMSNPETFHREFPDYYHCAEKLLHFDAPAQPHLRENVPSVALMCLLSGVYERDGVVAQALKRGDWSFRFGVAELYKNAGEWMSPEQFNSLEWAMDQIQTGRQEAGPVDFGNTGNRVYPLSDAKSFGCTAIPTTTVSMVP
jgi:hypothetical protein